LKFDKEFDFEKGFEEFSEMEKQLTRLKLDGNSSDVQPGEEDKPETNANNDGSTNGEKDGVDSDHFYDKTKSFFDTISCEALEREKGNVQRIDWKAERKLNSETFGVSLSYRRVGYGRGRGGYGYRGYSGGGYRNRGGGGFNRGAGGDTRRFKGPQLQPQQNRN
jgi:protein LSM14